MIRSFIFIFLLTFSTQIFAQTDSTAAVIQKIYNSLDSKDKVERSKYKSDTVETKSGTLGKITITKSKIQVPGMSNAVFTEGGGAMRTFTAEMQVKKYEDAVAAWDAFSKKLHDYFTGGWTFTENNNPRELYKNGKLVKDGSILSPVIRYALERNGTGFKLVMEMTY